VVRPTQTLHLLRGGYAFEGTVSGVGAEGKHRVGAQGVRETPLRFCRIQRW
jgi:hypothetical protein